MKHEYLDCTKCGKCCKVVGFVIAQAKLALSTNHKNTIEREILSEMANFPHVVNEDGVCSMLKDDLCSIFDTRPDICNVQEMWRKYWCKTGVSRQKHYINTKEICRLYKKQSETP